MTYQYCCSNYDDTVAGMQCYLPSSETWQNSVAHYSTIQVLGGLMKFRQIRIASTQWRFRQSWCGHIHVSIQLVRVLPAFTQQCRCILTQIRGLFLSAESCSLNSHSARRLCSCARTFSRILWCRSWRTWRWGSNMPALPPCAPLTDALIACLAAAEEKNPVWVAQPLLSPLLCPTSSKCKHTY